MKRFDKTGQEPGSVAVVVVKGRGGGGEGPASSLVALGQTNRC